MKTLKLVLVAAVVFCFASSLSYAQEMAKKGPCQADIEKFCKDIKPGQGRIAQCIKRHEAELSSACENHINIEKEKVREFVNACKPDAEKFCKDVKPGHGHIVRCLKQHQAEISPNCGGYLKK